MTLKCCKEQENARKRYTGIFFNAKFCVLVEHLLDDGLLACAVIASSAVASMGIHNASTSSMLLYTY